MSTDSEQKWDDLQDAMQREREATILAESQLRQWRRVYEHVRERLVASRECKKLQALVERMLSECDMLDRGEYKLELADHVKKEITN